MPADYLVGWILPLEFPRATQSWIMNVNATEIVYGQLWAARAAPFVRLSGSSGQASAFNIDPQALP